MALLHVTDIEVTSAEHHELTVRFDDGTRRRVELETLLTREHARAGRDGGSFH
jgi:hypothetical protein